MNDLSPEANELLEAGRLAFRPTATDRTRVLSAIKGAAAVSSGVAAMAVAKSSWAGVRSLFEVASFARVAAVIAPVAVGGAYAWQVATTPPQAPAPVPPAPVVTQPAPVKAVMSPSAPPPTAEVAESEPAPPPAPVSEPAKPSGAARHESQVRQEVELLSKAQAELSRGRPQRALEALSEHAQRFPKGALTEERMATRARALCALGRTGEAQAELGRVERLNAGSPYLNRAREACGSR
jgi:type IV secretory pathway VirB10-like protein